MEDSSMKAFLFSALAIGAISTVSVPANATDVGVSVSIGQPGFYGQIDIGRYPPPALVYRQPVLIEPVPYGRPPIYLRVPPGYAKHWDRHCREYNACGAPVYFVRDDWYTREYVPRYREQHGDHRHGERDQYHDHDRNDHREDHRYDNRDHDGDGNRGHGRDH
jgi:hypothetical protein